MEQGEGRILTPFPDVAPAAEVERRAYAAVIATLPSPEGGVPGAVAGWSPAP